MLVLFWKKYVPYVVSHGCMWWLSWFCTIVVWKTFYDITRTIVISVMHRHVSLLTLSKLWTVNDSGFRNNEHDVKVLLKESLLDSLLNIISSYGRKYFKNFMKVKKNVIVNCMLFSHTLLSAISSFVLSFSGLHQQF